MSTAGPVLSVDLAAIAANTRHLTTLCGGVMAVVKADGFGHGDLAVARTALASGAQWLGVATMEEALALRAGGLKAPILSWLNPIDADFDTALSAHIDLAVPSLQHLRAVATAAARTGARARVHLHADIGMARDGAPPQQWAMLTARAWVAERLGWLNVVGMMGHLPCADRPDHPSNTAGRQAFAQAVIVAQQAGLRPQEIGRAHV